MNFFKAPQLGTALFIASLSFLFSNNAQGQHASPWNAPESVKSLKNPFPADNASVARGKNSYKLECARCHGLTGQGDGVAAPKLDKVLPDLGDPAVQNQTDGELFWKISEGRRPMPYKAKALTDDQRWDVINYLRSLKHT